MHSFRLIHSNFLIQLLLISLSYSPYLQADSDDAAELHRSHCIGCHSRMTGGDGSLIYKRDDRIVQNKQELRQRVTHCSEGAKTNWNDSEITAVTDFLNEVIYQFPE